MVKYYGMLSTVVLTVFLSGEVLIPMTATVSPVQALGKERLFLSQNNLPPQSSDGGSRYADTSWRESFFNNQPPQSGDGGSRGGPLCPLTPLDEATGIEVWNDRPTFVWQGQLMRVELYDQNEDESIWSQDLAEDDQQVQYTGDPLKPGQTYNLMLYETVSDNFPFPATQVTFTVMDGEKRQQVSQALEQLNRELKQQNASEEIIALVRFNYLAENQLWSDALAEAFSVENPTKELQELREKAIPQKFCN
ncbi:hypothetical protein M595_0950 [Lyngbya aestuarii BL J]|uniref:DUF928 domain-containing protein n=1 Tax=Lyngbya aestuarii BL J TaxID=1348334 RepID=U7QRI5_9CYAN|nr:hypothetical protein [Lyngbya aestuarii]ERT09026.1 hypothetical protein M595_0950 [Lyngbya aestuarii BL J]